MKVLVTGGGGFLGFAIVEHLIKAGYEVVSYSRSHYKALTDLGVIHYQGDLSDDQTLLKALNGCEAVFHVASKVGMWGSYSSFYEANVTGTKNVLKACAQRNIRHLIFTSSPSVVYEGETQGADESLPYPSKYYAYYPETKAMAEQAVLQANGPTLTTCALRPHLVWGPKDPHFIPRIFERRRKNKLRLLGSGDYLVDTVYIDNAAIAHLQAFEAMLRDPQSVGGKAYFISQDEPITIRDFINRLLDTGDLPPVDRSIQPKIALWVGWCLQTTYRLLKIQSEPLLTPFIAKQLSSSHWYDISAAKRDFGYQPTVSIDEGMNRLKAWVKTNTITTTDNSNDG